MEVKNLLDRSVLHEITARINNLTPQNERRWGKMNVAQMLAHLKQAFTVPLSEKPLKRMFIGYILGPLVKSKMYNDKPWGRSLPTAPNFLITDERDFYKEKNELLELINQFHSKGTGGIGKYPHPLFGKMTTEQWGKAMWKHLDHHLQQFGV